MKLAAPVVALMLIGCRTQPCTQDHHCTCPCGGTCTTTHRCNEFPACTCCDSACADVSTDTDEESDGCLISIGGSELSPSALAACGTLGPHCPTSFDDGCPATITCPDTPCGDATSSCSYCPLGIFYGELIEASCEGGEWSHSFIHCDPPIECTTDEQCDDINSCTEDRCHLGECVHRNICDTEQSPDAPADVIDDLDASDIDQEEMLDDPADDEPGWPDWTWDYTEEEWDAWEW